MVRAWIAALACALSWGGGAAAAPSVRVASLAPSVTEILYAIGAQDELVGVSAQCDAPVAAKRKPRVGDFNRPDLARIKAQGADLVLFAEHVRTEDLETLRREGIAAEVLSARDLADLAGTVRRLGDLTGHRPNADAVASGIEAAVRELEQRFGALAAEGRPRVYVEIDGPQRLYAVGPGSFMDDMVRTAGGRNAFSDGPAAYFPVAPDAVVRADPEVILMDHPFQYKVGLSKRPGWQDIAAVRRGRVYDATDFDIVLFNRPGPRVVQALRQVARLLHPEAFVGRGPLGAP